MLWHPSNRSGATQLRPNGQLLPLAHELLGVRSSTVANVETTTQALYAGSLGFPLSTSG